MQALLLWLHFLGLALLGGAIVGGPIVDRFLWRAIDEHDPGAKVLLRMANVVSHCARAGAITMIVTGVGLLAVSHFAYWGVLWLNVKLVLFVLLAVNGAVVADRCQRQLEPLLPKWTPDKPAPVAAALARIRGRLRYFHVSETLMFVAVIVLAVFKFY